MFDPNHLCLQLFLCFYLIFSVRSMLHQLVEVAEEDRLDCFLSRSQHGLICFLVLEDVCIV